jgi:nitrite reductase/ring-hydroxylating ferredoxin subunit
MRMGTGLIRLCAARMVRDASPARVERDGRAYAIFTVNGRYFVTQDECTHGPGSLAEGWVEGEEVECPFHQGRFHIPTGQPTAAPCTIALRVWPARLIDEHIWIDTSAD